MNVEAERRDWPAAAILRRGLLGLVGLGVVGTTLELGFLGHWGSAGQAIVWPALAATGLAVAWVALRGSPRAVTAARIVAALVALVAGIGIWIHVQENLLAGPLDRAYEATWDMLPAVWQWWLAVTGSVGPAPTLAPGVLLELSLALGLATVAHPATRAVRADRAAVTSSPKRLDPGARTVRSGEPT